MNRSWWSKAATALLMALVGIACSQSAGTVGADCGNDGDCQSGLVCFNSTCIDPAASSTNCIVDAQCPAGSICLNGKCGQGPTSCQTDEECGEGEQCVSLTCVDTSQNPDPDCETDEECEEGKVCTKGACVDPDLPPVCENDEDCGDGEVCAEDGQCEAEETPACESDEDCDEGTCNTETGDCETESVACVEDVDCDDENSCTGDTCEEQACVHNVLPDQGCCEVNEDCMDKTCMLPECTDNQCDYAEVEDCCLIDHDCEDGNPLTVDTCEAYQCSHKLANCINDAECDDDNPCTFDSCKDGACENVSSADPLCCGKDTDCDDGNQQTKDFCVNGQCKFTDGLQSCDSDADCVDANPCTDEACIAGVCSDGWVDVPECQCITDQDCLGNKGGVCGLFQMGPSAIATFCTNVVGAKKGGALCDDDLECKSGYCVPLQSGEQICFGGCESDLDCDGTATCGAINFGLPGQDEPLSIPACVQPAVGCDGDKDCPEGELCFPSADPQKPETLHTICLGQQGNGNKSPGAICGADSDCMSSLCVDLFEKDIMICWAACKADADCPQGLYCYPNQVHFIFDQGTPAEADDKYFGLGMCAPYLGSFHPCGSDTDCPGGEFCHPYPNQTLTDIDPHCVTPFAGGTLQPGAQCSANAQCKSNDCANVGGIMNVCLGLCSANGDCAPGSSCTTIEYQMNNVALDVDVCLP